MSNVKSFNLSENLIFLSCSVCWLSSDLGVSDPHQAKSSMIFLLVRRWCCGEKGEARGTGEGSGGRSPRKRAHSPSWARGSLRNIGRSFWDMGEGGAAEG
jgi:hypothetical protein